MAELIDLLLGNLFSIVLGQEMGSQFNIAISVAIIVILLIVKQYMKRGK